jgi:prophage tail gpP-like protein
MGILRNYNFIAEDAKDSEIKQVVLSKAGQMFGDCVSYQLSVQGHRDRNGNLYEKNKLISLYSPNAMIYNETILLIKSLTMSRTAGGDTTSFNLVLPGSYTGIIPEVFPWEE